MANETNGGGAQTFEKFVNNSNTNLPLAEIIHDESHQILTVVIFTISAVLVIILIFVMAVFIDCRQQNIQKSHLENLKKNAKRRIKKSFPTLPIITSELTQKEDERTIVHNMVTEEPEPSTSSPACLV